jgi:hypothetical protein
MTEYEKAIHLQNKPLIPPGIIESDKSLSAYLEDNVKKNRQDEKTRQGLARKRQTWINKRLELAARKITVEPSTTEPIQPQTKTWKCKKTDKINSCNQTRSAEEPREGTLVTETIKGIIVVCDFCGHRWTHHSANLGRQYYTQCGICRRNVRLKHYQ